MKDFILICTVVSVFILGYFIMRKVDMCLAENNLQTKEHYLASSIRIAFETLDLVEQSAELLERFSKKDPSCEIMLFYGSAEKIETGLKNQELDFGFITNTCYDLLDGGFDSLFISIKQRTVISDSVGLSVIPLDKSEKNMKIVWIADGENYKKKMFAELLRSFSQSSTSYSANAETER